MVKKKATTKKTTNGKSNKGAAINAVHCPKDMSLETWQRTLRKNSAKNESETIHVKELTTEGENLFNVVNSKSGRVYRVEYFGLSNPMNRCECMDFRTNCIGTCKHIESVATYKNGKYAYVTFRRPEHSSVMVDYTNGRAIRLRFGKFRTEDIIKISAGIFDCNGFLLDKECDPSTFIRKAKEIDPEFEWEDDALDLLISYRDAKRRREIIEEKYKESNFTGLIKTKLHPYQVEGVKFAFKGGRTINADEMGLGKTVQAIATAELLRHEGMVESVIIICPTSLKYQWLSEIRRFTNSTAIVVEGDLYKRREQLSSKEYFYKICSFHAISNNIKANLIPTADMIIYDELQRLKNWDTQMGRQLRKLKSEYVLALSGTPLENKLNELYSVTQFVDQYVLGPLYKFNNLTTLYDETGRVIGYQNLHQVSEMLKDTLLRRRKADVKLQMPSRTDTNMFVPMTKEQRAIHDEYQYQVTILVEKWHRFKFLSEADRKRLMLFLSMMRMVCDSTFILDQKTRHDTKVDEVKAIVNNLCETGDGKVVIFSQWERMLRIIADELEKEGIDFCFLHGGVPSVKRKDLIDRFRDDPECRVFLSTDAGSTGLNLQTASLLINMDLPWNPAVLEQRIARIYRLGQENPVQIINMVSRDTIEERMLATLRFKSNLAAGILDGGEDAVFIDNNKFGKIIDMVEGVVEEESENPECYENSDNSENSENSDNSENSENSDNSENSEESENSENSDNSENSENSEESENSAPAEHPTKSASPSHQQTGENVTHSSTTKVNDFMASSMSFFGSLASVLREPDGAKAITDALVKEDPKTGQASLNIPVPDKKTVETLFTAIATLLNKQ